MPGRDPHPARARFRDGLDAWARAAGLAAMPAPGAAGSDPGEDPLICRSVGWRRPQSVGRGGDGLSILCDVLVMPADGSDRALGLLADLYARAPGHLEECAPVADADPLWRALGLAPRPALRASLRLEIRAAAPAAPTARRPVPGFKPMRPLSGEVRWRGKGVPDVVVSAPTSDLSVRTDSRGGFQIPHLSGDELILRKGNVEMRYRLADELHVVIDLHKEG